MSRFPFTLFGIIAVACCSAPLRADEATSASPTDFVNAWAAAFQDLAPAKMMSFYDRSKDTEVIVSYGSRLRGYDAIRKTYDDAKKEVRFLQSSAKGIKTRPLGDTALVVFEHVYHSQLLSNGSRWQGHVRTSMVLHRIDGQWKIVLEHSSPILGIDRVKQLVE